MPGHWEGDLNLGLGSSAVRDAITRTITTPPEQLRRSLTWDQGAEMSEHARLRIDTGVQIYFSVRRIQATVGLLPGAGPRMQLRVAPA